jgi:type I restriction enzyme R subunit
VNPDEEAFETEIVSWLVEHGGYEHVGQQGFEPTRGLDFDLTHAFIGATQEEQWGRLVKLHGGPAAAREAFRERLAKELDARGTVDVLRRGVVDRGIMIQLAYFRPASGITPELVERYENNLLTVVRQLRYEAGSGKEIDLALLVNGIPVATAELKNGLTGQGVDEAKEQYRTDRDPSNVTLGRRAIVHFAVDTEQVAMTTRLAGQETRFLPFNRGHEEGAGNPPEVDGHRTSYLWREVWQRDNWLDLLQRFVHVEKAPKGSRKAPTLIFPRYHQWDAVRKLAAAAKGDGAGRDYLVQHSAGSGKSNTIAWLAHRLSTLHDEDDDIIFDKVVVITDRQVLDKQLQETIYQFEHAHGVVEKVDKDSKQLAAALSGARARIVITTLQKFPVVLEQGVNLPDRRYAVIVDEAHSSQTGESAKDLKAVLGAPEKEQLETAEKAEAGGEAPDPTAEALEAGARARGKQQNISFFAFTATPKGRTLEQFGRLNPETNKREAFHTYSMRQAIEEGFILDVLANYVTYKTYWNIEKATPQDPSYDPKKAKAAIARFVDLHEENLGQKAEVIIEHFRRHVMHKIGGRAKAMVVTSSRLHAVKYVRALRKHCRDHGYGIGVLVAFSGTVVEGADEWTESSLNEFPDTQTRERFAGDEWQVLVVAEKYQTGFDQPLLYAMYVDKTLSGLAAVQTLSRLNRTSEAKDGTFVLDFRNKAEDIRESFEPWYTTTVAPPTDPNLLYDTRHALDPYGVLWPEEVERIVALLVGPERPGSHGRVHAALTPSIDRFNALDESDQDGFRDALTRFIRTYAFLSQVVTFIDVKLEADYLFCKALSAFVRPAGQASLDLGSEVELTHLRTEKTFEGSLALDERHGEVSTIFSGTGRQVAPEEEPLSVIVARLNERFSTEWSERDFVGHMTAITDRMADREDVQQAAAANTPENFKTFAAKVFVQELVAQLDVAKDISLKLLDNPDEQDLVLTSFLKLLQGRAKVAWQEHCPIGDLLGPEMESQHLEYKATLRVRDSTGEVYKPLESEVLKTVAAFANSRDGGTLLIGVANDGSPFGLAGDYASLSKPGKDDHDQFQLHLGNIISASMGAALAANVATYIHTIDGADVCRVHVHTSAVPVDAKVIVEGKNGQMVKKTAFYVRTGPATRELDATEKAKHILNRWPSS